LAEKAFETLDVRREGPVTLVTLDRPERLNAINARMMGELVQVWNDFDADPDQRVAVLTGAGSRAFCTGADVKELAEGGGLPKAQRDPDVTVANRFTPWQLGVRKPTICAVNGICAGGGLHFVTDCDIVFAAEAATFMDPHVSVGLVSALEPIGLVARGVPLGAILRLVLAGAHESMSAKRAWEIGMVAEVIPGDELLHAAMAFAAKVAANSPAAVAASRRAIREAVEGPLMAASQRGWELIQAHWDHPDFIEGMQAFAEKRLPRWAADATSS